MKSTVTYTILGTPFNWLHRAICRLILSVKATSAAKILRIAFIASLLYFAAVVLAIGMVIALAAADAVRCIWFF
ncbi:hypothetical protein [Caballeronia sp. dw_276]|uniref:hypothetical protein n=1 Tax=Caballeronia sp. dw_276 TaxID=2719795 RepID=UPI001BD5E4E5|nr:hypothetical protein [Caballeronia sp. dw_276]